MSMPLSDEEIAYLNAGPQLNTPEYNALSARAFAELRHWRKIIAWLKAWCIDNDSTIETLRKRMEVKP